MKREARSGKGDTAASTAYNSHRQHTPSTPQSTVEIERDMKSLKNPSELTHRKSQYIADCTHSRTHGCVIFATRSGGMRSEGLAPDSSSPTKKS